MNDAGRIGFLPKGKYSSEKTYDFLDVVYYNGNSYVAKKETTGNAPVEEDEYWQILALGGEGGGGVTDYEDLDNKPRINNIELQGDIVFSDLNPSYNDLQDTPESLPADGGIAENVSGIVTVEHGGTGAKSVTEARTKLGLKDASTQAVTNNLTTTEAGSVLDARQGKVLDDKVTELSDNLGGFTPIIDPGTGEITGYKTKRGADTVFPFSSGSKPELLWTNPSPNLNSSQAGDIELDLSEYEAVAFIFNAATNLQFGGTLSTPIPVIDEGTTPLSHQFVGATVYKDSGHTTVDGILRARLYATKTKISYGGGTCIWYSGGVSFTNGIIKEVYGYKKSPIPQEE